MTKEKLTLEIIKRLKEEYPDAPQKEGSSFCHRLVFHGREICTALTKPHCDKCVLQDICAKNV